MADSFHFSVNIISRGKGKSAVASAAYISGEKIKNEWDGVSHDYTRKEKVLVKNIIWPDHIPMAIKRFARSGAASVPNIEAIFFILSAGSATAFLCFFRNTDRRIHSRSFAFV